MFFVHYNRGNCIDGDHDYGLEPFDTLEAAQEFVKQVEAKDGTWTTVEGEVCEGHLTIHISGAPQ